MVQKSTTKATVCFKPYRTASVGDGIRTVTIMAKKDGVVVGCPEHVYINVLPLTREGEVKLFGDYFLEIEDQGNTDTHNNGVYTKTDTMKVGVWYAHSSFDHCDGEYLPEFTVGLNVEASVEVNDVSYPSKAEAAAIGWARVGDQVVSAETAVATSPMSNPISINIGASFLVSGGMTFNLPISEGDSASDSQFDDPTFDTNGVWLDSAPLVDHEFNKDANLLTVVHLKSTGYGYAEGAALARADCFNGTIAFRPISARSCN